MLTPDSAIVAYCDGMDCDLSHRLMDRLRELGYHNVRHAGQWLDDVAHGGAWNAHGETSHEDREPDSAADHRRACSSLRRSPKSGTCR